jgi:hypothetical protein
MCVCLLSIYAHFDVACVCVQHLCAVYVPHACMVSPASIFCLFPAPFLTRLPFTLHSASPPPCCNNYIRTPSKTHVHIHKHTQAHGHVYNYRITRTSLCLYTRTSLCLYTITLTHAHKGACTLPPSPFRAAQPTPCVCACACVVLYTHMYSHVCSVCLCVCKYVFGFIHILKQAHAHPSPPHKT